MKDPVLNPIHPGELLLEDFLKPLSLSQYKLAKRIRVPARRINEIVLGRRGISADTALRLARFFNTTAQFWLNLQSYYELDRASLESAAIIQQEIQPLSKAA
jgi:addiction module HigA family antidote